MQASSKLCSGSVHARKTLTIMLHMPSCTQTGLPGACGRIPGNKGRLNIQGL